MHAHGDLDRFVDQGVLARGRVVVGIPEVPAVDEAAVPLDPVEREGAAPGVDRHRHEAIAHRHRSAGLAHHDRVGQRGWRERLPAVAGNVGGPGHDAADGGLVQVDPDDGVGPCSQAGVNVLLRFRDRHVGPFLGSYRDRDLEPFVLLFHAHVVHPRVVVDLGSLEHAEHGAHGVGIEHHGAGEAGALGDDLHLIGGRLIGPDHEFDQARPRPLDAIEHVVARLGQGTGERSDGAIGETVGNGARLGVAVQDGVDHIVDRAGTDRVVRRVADHFLPRQGQQLVWPWRGRSEEGGQRFGPPLQGALGQRPHALHVDAVGRHPHQHVGPVARPELSLPAFQPLSRRRGQILRERGDLEREVVLELVRFRHHATQPALGEEMVRAVHTEEVVDEEGRHFLDEVLGAPHERFGIVGERGTVAVADG